MKFWENAIKYLKNAGLAMRRIILAREREGILGRASEADLATSPYLDAIGLNPDHACELLYEFELAAGGTLHAGLTAWDVSAAGTPTKDYVADAAGGQYTFAHDNTNEAQIIGLYGGDQRIIPVAGQPIFQARLKLTPDAATMSADQRFIVGLCSDINTTFDSVATHAWFRMEGANLNIYYESDDGTTDDDDNDSALDFVKGTFFQVRIDLTNLSSVKFYVNLEDGQGWRLVGTTSMAAATGTLQIVCALQKDAGTETDSATVDYFKVLTDRV